MFERLAVAKDPAALARRKEEEERKTCTFAPVTGRAPTARQSGGGPVHERLSVAKDVRHVASVAATLQPTRRGGDVQVPVHLIADSPVDGFRQEAMRFAQLE